jgi:hypothetical protein
MRPSPGAAFVILRAVLESRLSLGLRGPPGLPAGRRRASRQDRGQPPPIENAALAGVKSLK